MYMNWLVVQHFELMIFHRFSFGFRSADGLTKALFECSGSAPRLLLTLPSGKGHCLVGNPINLSSDSFQK